MDYNDYLRSDYWKQRRYAALERVEFRCQLCGECDSLEVHHLSYERLGNEDPADLFVICKSHHWMEHNPEPALPAAPVVQVQEPAPVRVYAGCKKGRKMYKEFRRWDPKNYKQKLIDYNQHANHCRICKPIPTR